LSSNGACRQRRSGRGKVIQECSRRGLSGSGERRNVDAEVPKDRPIDGVDQSEFLLGQSETSKREDFLVFVADRLEAVKWRNWKLVFYEEQCDWWSPPTKLGTPKGFDLITDPKEEYSATAARNTWNAGPAMKIVVEFEKSLKEQPPIAPGTPDPYPHRADGPLATKCAC
jgi:arylsulfatase